MACGREHRGCAGPGRLEKLVGRRKCSYPEFPTDYRQIGSCYRRSRGLLPLFTRQLRSEREKIAADNRMDAYGPRVTIVVKRPAERGFFMAFYSQRKMV